MIRWYDFAFALLFADAIQAFFFGFPIIGAGVAYAIYFAWINYYCEWRKVKEIGQ